MALYDGSDSIVLIEDVMVVSTDVGDVDMVVEPVGDVIDDHQNLDGIGIDRASFGCDSCGILVCVGVISISSDALSICTAV